MEVHEEGRWLLRAASSIEFQVLTECAYQSAPAFHDND